MITKEHDHLFELQGGKWLPEWGWKYIKAIAYAFSMLQPDYRSPEGRLGLLGLTREQWDDAAARLRFSAAALPLDPVRNVEAGVYYLAVMRGGWGSPREESERQWLTLASYYVGFDTVLKAKDLMGSKQEDINRGLEGLTPRPKYDALHKLIGRVEETYEQLKKHEVN